MNSADKKGNQNEQQRRKSTSSEGPRTGTNSTNSQPPDNKKLSKSTGQDPNSAKIKQNKNSFQNSQKPAQGQQQQTRRLSSSTNSARSSDQKGVDDALEGHEIQQVTSGGTIVETTSPTTQQKQQQQRKNSGGQQQQRRLSADNNKGTKPQVSDRRRSSSLKTGDTGNKQRPAPSPARGPGNNFSGGAQGQGQPRKLSVNPNDRNKVHPYPRPNQNKKLSQPKSTKPPPSVSSDNAGVQNPEAETDDILLLLPGLVTPNPKLDPRPKGLESGATQTLAPLPTKDNFTEAVSPGPGTISPGISRAHLTGTAFTFLEETKELNIFLRDEPLVFETPGMVLSSFDVLNDKGETIFFIAEIKSKCFLCTKWSHFLAIYSLLGELVMTVVKRNKNLCHSRATKYRNTAEMQPYIFADRSLPTEAVIVNPFLESNVPPVQDPEAAYHVRLTDGQFVGHFKENKLANENTNPYRYILFDIDFRALYQIREVQPMVKNEIVQGNTFQETIFPYMQIYHNHRPIGKIYSGADLRKFGIGTIADHCYHADFPHDIPPVNKALILGLVAVSHCETYPVEDSVCLNCCIVCSRTKCVIC